MREPRTELERSGRLEHAELVLEAPFAEHVLVDSGIAALMQELWRRGVRTYFSCEGNPGSASVFDVAYFVTDGPTAPLAMSLIERAVAGDPALHNRVASRDCYDALTVGTHCTPDEHGLGIWMYDADTMPHQFAVYLPAEDVAPVTAALTAYQGTP